MRGMRRVCCIYEFVGGGFFCNRFGDFRDFFAAKEEELEYERVGEFTYS